MGYGKLLSLTTSLMVAKAGLALASVVMQVPESCPVAGVYDQRCIQAALRSVRARPAATLQLGCHTYMFTAPVTLDLIRNVDIAGSGACTKLTYAGRGFHGATLLTFRDSRDISLHDLTIVAPVVPEPVTISSLPATGPFTSTVYVAIDRGLGHPYVPTINDQDIVPVELGGQCRSHCISQAQLGAAADLQVLFVDSQNLTLYHLQGRFATLTLQHVQNATVRDSAFIGGGKINSWGLIAVLPGSGSNTDIRISGNHVQQSAFSGIIARATEGLTIGHNVSSYNGESGFKIGQGAANYVSGMMSNANQSMYNHYDGFDYSEDVYNGKTITFQVCNCTSTDDISAYNQGTGFITNGAKFIYTRPVAHDNLDAGMDTVLDRSVIEGGVFTDNNAGHQALVNQIAIDQPDAPKRGSLRFAGNNITVTTKEIPGYGIYITDGRYDTLLGNTVHGAKIWDASNDIMETDDVDEDGPHNHKP